MSIDLYYWPTPNGWKITIALEEMGLPYTIHPVDIGKGAQFEPEFLKISPNNRMPAIVDHEGPDGAPIAIFESGAILLYLSRKTGLFGGANMRERAEIESWLMWQMGGFGPMMGQANHFRHYAPTIEPDADKTRYSLDRYTNEVNRLYGVMDKRLADREHLAGDLSIADFATWPWAILWERVDQKLEDFPNVAAWLERCRARPAFETGRKVGDELRRPLEADTEEAKAQRAMLFGQRART